MNHWAAEPLHALALGPRGRQGRGWLAKPKRAPSIGSMPWRSWRAVAPHRSCLGSAQHGSALLEVAQGSWALFSRLPFLPSAVLSTALLPRPEDRSPRETCCPHSCRLHASVTADLGCGAVCAPSPQPGGDTSDGRGWVAALGCAARRQGSAGGSCCVLHFVPCNEPRRRSVQSARAAASSPGTSSSILPCPGVGGDTPACLPEAACRQQAVCLLLPSASPLLPPILWGSATLFPPSLAPQVTLLFLLTKDHALG